MLRRERNALYIGPRLRVTASRWPWQYRTHRALLSSDSEAVGTRYGWRGSDGMGRFGGGWNWCLGFRAGGSSIYIALLIGAISFNWYKHG